MKLEGFSEKYQAEKERWRKQMNAVRRSITQENHRKWSQLACRRLNGLLDVLGARSVGVYSHVRGEVDLTWLWEINTGIPRIFYFPRISNDCLTFHEVRNPGEELQPGDFGIPAPSSASPSTSPSALEVIVLPGLAFDLFGSRVGSGAGCYDRLLVPLKERPHLVGAAFAFQLIWEETLPSGSQDVPMDWIATNRECVRCLPCSYS